MQIDPFHSTDTFIRFHDSFIRIPTTVLCHFYLHSVHFDSLTILPPVGLMHSI